AGVEHEGVVGAGGLGIGPRGVEEEAGALVGREEFAVGKEAAFAGGLGGGGVGVRPLDAAAGGEVCVVADAGDVAGTAARKFLDELKGGGGGGPLGEAVGAAPGLGDELEDL